MEIIKDHYENARDPKNCRESHVSREMSREIFHFFGEPGMGLHFFSFAVTVVLRGIN